jgi:glycosyltransferase involved in cell wall biosynthesis
LILTNLYPPHHYGGYELTCHDFVERCRSRGHEVQVLTTQSRVPGVADPVDERSSGIRRDLRWYWDDHRFPSVGLLERLSIERANGSVLSELLGTFEPDVVSVWHMGAMSQGLLALLVARQLAIVCVVCDDWLTYGPDVDPWARLFLRRPRLAVWARRRLGVPTAVADLGGAAFCFVSVTTRRQAEADSRFPLGHRTVVYSAIDPNDFPVVASPPDRPWDWRLLYVGRLDPRKGIETVMRALALVPATFDVVGRGDAAYTRSLKTLAERLGVGDRTRFAAADRAELRNSYQTHDAVVFPVEWEEPFGLVPLEAMACGTPVVATGRGGSGEYLVDGGNSLLFPPRDSAALARSLLRLASDRPLRRMLAENGLRTAAQFDMETWGRVLEDWHVAAAERFAHGVPADRRPPALP